MKKQGKIRAIPVTSEVIGQQVWHPRKYGIAKTKWSDERIGDGMVLIQSGLCTVTVQKANLRQLVVEYRDCCGRCDGINDPCEPETRQIPLKYSQWQAAIDAGEVDSDKVVTFEEMSDVYDSSPDGKLPTILRRWYARVIPARKRVFTEADLAAAFMAGRAHEDVYGFAEDEVRFLNPLFSDWFSTHYP